MRMLLTVTHDMQRARSDNQEENANGGERVEVGIAGENEHGVHGGGLVWGLAVGR